MDTFEKETQKEIIPYSDLAIMNKLLSYNFVKQNRKKKANGHLEICKLYLPPALPKRKEIEKELPHLTFKLH